MFGVLNCCAVALLLNRCNKHMAMIVIVAALTACIVCSYFLYIFLLKINVSNFLNRRGVVKPALFVPSGCPKTASGL